MEYFIKLIKRKHSKDVSNDKKAVQKLRREAERAKRSLSNQHQVRVEIESLYDGIDFSEPLTRARFEELNNDLFLKTMGPVKKAMEDAGMKKSQIDEIVLVGGFNINPSGTITLGLAEGGKRITFFNTDFVDLKDKEDLIRFVATIQHEYTHILNQNIPFDREIYEEITPSGYTAQWFNSNDNDSRELGFISAYARSNEDEDFAEMVTALLSNNNTEYNAIIDAITSEQAKTDIRAKEAIIVKYFKTEFNLDIYELQRVAAENVEKVLNSYER